MGRRFRMSGESEGKTVGMVTSRPCPACGHHEIGYVTEDGQFHPLRPGTAIQVLERADLAPSSKREEDHQEVVQGVRWKEDKPVYRVWLPEALRRDRVLRLKYGVMVREVLRGGNMSAAAYQRAYQEKLRNLIEKADEIPVAVSLDRFFASPHLASGNPAEIVEAMWRELEEVNRPVRLMRAWLERQDEESFAELIAPRSGEELSAETTEDAALAEELEALTLEAFLETL
jgi:hypothetical protein